ncbi:UBX-domain-containing protein [Rhizopus microsporus]|uniref:UBX-domain-containing protein n=1 Tax=Rhizopus microsporus TaxID=58291 RepID=A0A1X0RYN1_RHIZD|nr:UBX-domain-containing protein [Rhizopus microsporus]
MLEHPEVSDEPEEEEEQPKELGSEPVQKEEGEIQQGEQTASSLICNDCQKLFRDATGAERHAARTGHQNFAESTEVIKPLTEEEKKQKLAELRSRMAEKRAIREAQEAAERREAERIRRKAGKEISAAKEELQAKEIKQAFEMKKKEKELDRIAKAKVKAQIEADKRERAAKVIEKTNEEAAKQSQAESAPAPAATSTSQPAVKKEYNDARLQIRIPGMSPVTNTFSATSTLSEVYSFLQSQGCTNPFTLSTTFPRKTFGEEDKEKTLKELNLVPSAALILAFI